MEIDLEELDLIEKRLNGFSYIYDQETDQIIQIAAERTQQHADASRLLEIVRALLNKETKE